MRMKLNDEELKKALEDFYHRAENTNLSYHIFESEREALKDAIALINLQQNEIECLQRAVDILKGIAEDWKSKAQKYKKILLD